MKLINIFLFSIAIILICYNSYISIFLLDKVDEHMISIEDRSRIMNNVEVQNLLVSYNYMEWYEKETFVLIVKSLINLISIENEKDKNYMLYEFESLLKMDEVIKESKINWDDIEWVYKYTVSEYYPITPFWFSLIENN